MDVSSLGTRYARQIVLPMVGKVGQQRLADAKVLVVGCGGLGAPVIQYLAGAGVGSLTLMDDDVVEASNLNRQVLHRERDVGRRKAERAAEAVAELNGGIRVTARAERLAARTAREVIQGFDAVVDCSDGMPTKFLLNDACVLQDVPLVHGAATALSGQVLVVPGKSGPCLRCLFEEPPPRGTLPTCREAGILGPVTGVVGSTMALHVLRLLMNNDRGRSLAGQFQALDLADGNSRTLRFQRRSDCAACGDVPSVDARTESDYEVEVCDIDEA